MPPKDSQKVYCSPKHMPETKPISRQAGINIILVHSFNHSFHKQPLQVPCVSFPELGVGDISVNKNTTFSFISIRG